MPRLKGYRFPRYIIAYAVWAYHRFTLSTADVEDLLAERGVIVSRETVCNWVNRFGQFFAACIRGHDTPWSILGHKRTKVEQADLVGAFSLWIVLR